MCGECKYYKPISNCRGHCTIKDCTKNAGTKHCGNFSEKGIALFLKELEKGTCRNIADVYICLKQMEMFLDIEGDVKGFIDYKIDRQLNRIVNNK